MPPVNKSRGVSPAPSPAHAPAPSPKDGLPDVLRPFKFHGVPLKYRPGQAECGADSCPFCGGEKWSLNVEKGTYQCWSCQQRGEIYTFLRWLHGRAEEATKPADYAELARDRGLLNPDTLVVWGAAKSPLTGDWLLPGYAPDGKIVQLYRYCRDPKRAGKRVLLATPTLHHGLFGVNLWDKDKPAAFVGEGPWDAMALWEGLRGAKRTEDGVLAPTASEESSLLATHNVLAAPGCAVWQDRWGDLLAGKDVVLPFDNDHPKTTPDGKVLEPAAWQGMRRAAQSMAGRDTPPSSVCYLSWGGPGATHDPGRKHGHDLRDELCSPAAGPGGAQEVPGRAERCERLAALLKKVHPAPDDWIPGRSGEAVRAGKTEISLLPCSSWEQMLAAWRDAMLWPEPGTGLDHALAVMLAAVVSTMSVGDQLWVKVVSPPSTGKSELAEALSTNKRYVKAVSTLTGFHSGYRETGGKDEDNSLTFAANEKTLIIKDGDTLLQQPNLGQILSQARDIYDGVSRTFYRNKASKEYEGMRMTFILCGTSSLRGLDSSELGERFLDCVIMDGIDPEVEQAILWRAVNKADANCRQQANGTLESKEDPLKLLCRRLTGGYVSHLRENAAALFAGLTTGATAKRDCMDLGKFVAYMRSRPSPRQKETAEREMGARLSIQMMRLANCLAVVLNKTRVDDEVMARVRRVALDTARGRVLNIAHALYRAGDEGMQQKALLLAAQEKEDDKDGAGGPSLLSFLRKVDCIEYFSPPKVGYVKQAMRWRLTKDVRQLYERVVRRPAPIKVGRQDQAQEGYEENPG